MRHRRARFNRPERLAFASAKVGRFAPVLK